MELSILTDLSVIQVAPDCWSNRQTTPHRTPCHAASQQTGADTDPQFGGKIPWNHEKFLIGRDGQIVARFKHSESPDSPEVVAAIVNALAQK